jgi:hypothetical protein
MKDPMELLRFKEQEVLRVKKEIEALRLTARLLEDAAIAGAGVKNNGTQKHDLP